MTIRSRERKHNVKLACSLREIALFGLHDRRNLDTKDQKTTAQLRYTQQQAAQNEDLPEWARPRRRF